MKSSLFIAVTGAALAAAGPIRAPLEKRVMETDWVYQIVTVTVTAGDEPTPAVFLEQAVTTTSVAPPPPPPETTSTPPPPPTTSSETVVYTTIVEAPQEPSPTPTPVEETPSEPAPSPTLGDYEGTLLSQHNLHRSNHSAPALEWDATLAQYAENTAKGCVFAHDMNQGNGGYGQNLASFGSTGDISGLQVKTGGQAVTDQWYNSEMMNWQYYGLDNPPQGLDLDKFGHFTQVVWKSSTKVGCATVQCPAGTVLGFDSWYTVCNYSPPGNFGGEYGSNVLQPLGQAIASI